MEFDLEAISVVVDALSLLLDECSSCVILLSEFKYPVELNLLAEKVLLNQAFFRTGDLEVTGSYLKERLHY